MARKALRALSRKTPTYVEIADHFEYLKRERNDRAVAILAFTLVEDALEDAILSRLAALPSTRADLLEGVGPLSTFSAKIRIAFALCLIGSFTRADLDCMRDIRNAFAHARTHLKFTTPEVKAACQTLQNKTSKPFRKNASPRFRYLETAEKITHDLLGEAIEDKRPNPPSLP